MSDPERAMYWVQRNRRRVDRAVAVGLPADRLARGILEDALPEGLASRLSSLVDETFRRSCTVQLAGGLLTVYVRDASMVDWLRRRWVCVLEQSLAGRAGVRSVRFRHGCAGSALVDPVGGA